VLTLDDATLPDVLRDVGATLRRLLQEQIVDLRPEVVLASPADIDVTTALKLGLFLYQVVEMPQMRNDPPEPVRLTDGNVAVRRYQTVELFYLVTPYTQEIEDAHRLLGRVMRVFFAHGTVQGSILQGNLADIGQELRILLHPLSMEELNRFWGLFPNKAYRLSIAYQVTPVKIFAGLTEPASRVITRELSHAQLVERR
jgi:hypothetical protein